MIEIKRDGSRVLVTIESHIPRVGMRVFSTAIQCSGEIEAGLLAARLHDELADTIRAIRKAEYDAGWKDARGRKRPKRDWFTWLMKRQASA